MTIKRTAALICVAFAGAAAIAAACLLAGAAHAAEWIKGGYVRPDENDVAAFYRECPNDVLKRTFSAHDAPVAKATWRVAAVGMRDLFVNGERVTPTALPPLTVYRKRVLEESFDVTRHIRPGRGNELRVELGNGWWNLTPLKIWYVYEMWKTLPQGEPAVRGTLEVEYADGRRQTVETDGEWLASRGRIVKNSIYLGVKEDARRAEEPWTPARPAKGPAGKVVDAGDFPKTVVYDRWPAKEVKQVRKGVWRVDFGVNFAGTFRAALRGVPKGAVVRFRSGERMNDDGTVNTFTAVAEQRDEWVADGAAESVFEPRFTFHVFRYLQVEGMPVAPKPEDFEALAWSADVAEGAHFECSEAKLNLLHEVCRRTFRSNLQSVQSDCPGREKFGYGGDIAASAESFRCNWAMAPFYRKTVCDFLDEAADDGLFTETAPFVGIASKSVYPAPGQPPNSFIAVNGTRAAPMGWTLGVPVLVDLLVRYDGDMEIAREAYPALVRFVDLLSERYPDDDLPECLGDWIAIEKADAKLTSLAHWHEFVSKTARFAKLLGRADDERRLSAHAERIAERFRRLYVKPGGVVNAGVQGEQLFALHNGLLEPRDVPAALGVLKADIVAHGRSLTTGFFATQYLFEALSANGMADLAGDVATHRGFPGYYHMIDRGATTLWEDWKEERNRSVESNCHPMFGSVEQWLMRYVLGICVAEDAVGCDKVRIAPHAVAGLTSASGWLDTPKGRILVNWRIVDGEMKLEKSIPPGVAVAGERGR